MTNPKPSGDDIVAGLENLERIRQLFADLETKRDLVQLLGLAEGGEKPPHNLLSDREYRVMWLIASGKHINEIAAEMFLSPSTISTYRARILKKLGLSNNAALVRYAVKYRLI